MGVTLNNLSSYNSAMKINYGETIIFFKFGADWCIPCVELDKVLVNIPNSMIYHISIENEEFESYLTDNKIYTVPDTIVKYKDQTIRFQGMRTTEQIMKIIEDLKSTVA